MANGTVEIPVVPVLQDLEIRTGTAGLNGNDVNKAMEKIGTTAGESFNKALNNEINLDGATTAVRRAGTKLVGSLKTYSNVYENLANAREAAALSSGEYESDVRDWKKREAALEAYEVRLERFNQNAPKTFSKINDAWSSYDTKKAMNLERYAKGHYKDWWKEYEALQSMYTDIYKSGYPETRPDPNDYLSGATKETWREVVKAYNAVLKAQENATKAQDDLNAAGAKSPYTESYIAKQKELAKVLAQIARLESQVGERNATGRGINPQVADYRKQAYLAQVRDLTNSMLGDVQSGNAFVGGFGDADAEASKLNSTLAETEGRLNNLKTSGSKIGTFFSKHFSGMGKSVLKLISVLTGANLAMRLFGKSSKGATGGWGGKRGWSQMTKNIMQFGLGIRSAYYLVKQLRTLINQELTLMAAQIPAVNTQMSAMKTSLNQLKGSLATAFQPILSIIVPALQTLTSWLVTAMNAIARFFATLTGQGVIYKFTSATQDAASSLSGAGGAASDAKKQLDRTLLSFDKMNKLQKNDSSSGGGGGSGSGAGGTWSEEASAAQSKLAQLMKSGWQNSDFTKVGEYLGEKLLADLVKLESTYIPKWDAFFQKLGKVAATAINGFVSVDGLGEKIGNVLSELMNMFIHGFGQFFDALKGLQVGNFIGELFGGMINEFDIKGLGHTLGAAIADMIEIALGAASGLLDTVNWEQLGHRIVDGIKAFLTAIDWNAIISTSFELLGKAISSFILLVLGIFEGIVDTFAEFGKNVGEGFTGGLKEFFKSIGTWIKTNILQPFVDGFKSAFQIHSPSKLTEGFGKDVIEGFLLGLIEKAKELPKTIKTKVTNIVEKAFKNIKEFTIKISALFTDTKAKLKKTWETLTADIKDITRNAKMEIKQKWSDIKSKWTSLTKNIEDITRKATMECTQKWNGKLKTSWEALTKNIKDKKATATLDFATTGKSAWNAVAKKVNNMRANHPLLAKALPPMSYLAKGAVIPPNREFLAVLGDQKHGTNIETPLETMIEAFNTALAQSGFSGAQNINVVLEGDAKGVFKLVRTEANNYTKSTGKAAFNI